MVSAFRTGFVVILSFSSGCGGGVTFNDLTAHQPPYEVKVLRYVPSGTSIYTALLDQYFKGPGATEYYSYGYRAIYDGFNGYNDFSLTDGAASIILNGSCKREYNNYSIAQLLQANLKQFPEISTVKIFDAQGQTENPTGTGDSVPACLDLNSTPTPPFGSLTPITSLTPPPPPGPTLTPTASSTPLPPGTATRWPSTTPRPTDTRWPTSTPRP